MSGPIVLFLRLLMATALYAFLGWALFLLWNDVRREASTIARRRAPGISLTVQTASNPPIQKHFIRPEIILGRDPLCDIPLPDDTVSARHARLTYHHGQWWLEDLGSTNGTLLNDELLSVPTVLTSGDEIRCGNSRLVVDLAIEMLSPPTQRIKE
jgi:pSer/pThr/pTyr-binding forkhead associated (FHA) protein